MRRLSIHDSLIFNGLAGISPQKEKSVFPSLYLFYYFAIIVFVVMFQSGELTLFNLNKNLLLGISFFLWLTQSFYAGRIKDIDFGFLEYFFVFSLFLVISSLNALDKKYVLLEFAKWMRMPLIYLLLINNIKIKEQLNTFLLMLGYFISTILLYGIYEFVFNPDYLDPFRQIYRATSIFNRPNVYSLFIVAMLPFLFFALIQSKDLIVKRIFFIVSIILAGINLYLTKSRLGLLIAGCLTMSTLIIALFANKKLRILFLKALSLLLMVFLLLIIFIWISEKSILIKYVTVAESLFKWDPSNSARTIYLEIALKIIKAHPLLGIGAGNYPLVSKLYAPYFTGNTGLTVGVHNKYLNIAMEMGLLAMIAFIAFLAVHLKLLWGFLRKSKDGYLNRFSGYLFLSLIATLGYLLFEVSASTVITWYLGIALGLIVVLNKENFGVNN